ncbi:MAG: hypothetical protein KL787_01475 [Taibaiella sp.]|nr:hypothetical protein [Taibaiella sp.]
MPELVYYHTGIDWVKNTILNAIGEEVDLQLKFEKPVAAIIIESPKDGVYRGFEVNDKEMRNQILEFEITTSIGEQINQLRKGTDRIGKIVAYGDNVEEAEKRVEIFRNEVQIIVE